ncbi:MAG: peptide deformylase [Candidatus Omnitrophica bacterium]|nr:peptide deformylase [Candidatus Omnitrophota bacterium]
MADLKINKFPDPILRSKAAKVTKVTQAEKDMLSDMARTMYLSQGVGLAAVQVGIDKQLAVVDVGDGLIKMVNPVIVKKEGAEACEEGCLSCPGATVTVERAKKIVVSFMNEDGDVKELTAEGLLARAIQHELDHLSGKLIIDYLGPIKKMLAKRKIRKG